MNYLLLSDIHGNDAALAAVLAAVPTSRYDAILVLGDNVGDGPCPDKVLAELANRGAVQIAGNREELAVRHFDGFAETQAALQWKFMRDSLSFLSASQRDALRTLRNQKFLTDGDLSLRMVHGSPFSFREVLRPENTVRLEEALSAVDEPILLCGHYHYQYAYPCGQKLLLNPGSVGLSQKGEAFRADYALLHLSGNQVSFELNHTYYDGEAVLRSYKERGLWNATLWGRLAYREMSEGKPYIIGFARYVFSLAKQKGVDTHPLDDEIWKEASRTWQWTPAK
ncbi:MAG: metallophosphoesterase family protein [Clostridia bacterium]|nr:metallophosphoesterase family protein [Clostridia bacterium]